MTLKKRSGRRRPRATWSSSRTRTEDVRGQPTSTCFVSIDCLDSYKNLGSSALLSSTPFYVCRKSRREGVSSSEGAELASDPGRMPPGSGSRTYYFTYLSGIFVAGRKNTHLNFMENLLFSMELANQMPTSAAVGACVLRALHSQVYFNSEFPSSSYRDTSVF